MANYIYTILISKLMVILSWGFNSPIAITNGLRFKVQGFKFTGVVEVIYNAGMDLFEIHLSDGRVEADVCYVIKNNEESIICRTGIKSQ